MEQFESIQIIDINQISPIMDYVAYLLQSGQDIKFKSHKIYMNCYK